MCKLNILFLDDNEERIKGAKKVYGHCNLIIARTAQEAITELENNLFDLVCLDHDLGGEVYVDSNREDCGMEVVRFLIVSQIRPRVISIHTWNIPAGQAMQKAFRDEGYFVFRIPYNCDGWDIGNRLDWNKV